ncbi:hypothetical protein BOTBODRAFT_46002 [Botryobasidium botryosum FD-172 SS1]|uniref:glutathione transferase n=1 Tax=Botryobasidium botryosum (strain FD-172 SS1) TaxID=930990 RepID=A0A067M8N6_BOTB1|nr:hypothetical protein BOTBODRAFT_46002 [Botryobasidium botryosum FD-172 SS1]
MVYRIHDTASLTSTRRAAVVAQELGVPYEIVPVDVSSAEHKSEAYLKKNPFGRIPILYDDDFGVVESRAIGRYLAAKSGEKDAKLAPPPSDARAYARFEEAASLEYSDFDVVVSKLGFELLVKKVKNLGESDQVLVVKYYEELKVKMMAYDRILAERRYLAGDNLTLADLFHLPMGAAFEQYVGMDWASYGPNVGRWSKEISSLESWKVVASKKK